MAADTNTIKTMIHIDSDYCISVDGIDYSLRRVRVSQKSGDVSYVNVGYYGSIQNCLNAYVREKMHDAVDTGNSMSLLSAIDRIERAVYEVKSTIEKAFPEYMVVKK